MNKNEIWQSVELHLRKAKKGKPNWPDHPAAQAGMVAQHAGELVQASMDWKYERSASEMTQDVQREKMITAALQTIANSIRFLEHI
jgi:hypothetical protein